jgi:hypothetical protein
MNAVERGLIQLLKDKKREKPYIEMMSCAITRVNPRESAAQIPSLASSMEPVHVRSATVLARIKREAEAPRAEGGQAHAAGPIGHGSDFDTNTDTAIAIAIAR